ncbi:MAG: NAD(+)/NADH kinase [Phycisphaerales bacterium]
MSGKSGQLGVRQGRSLPRLILFGDPEKGPVAQVMEDFSQFFKGQAEVIAVCHIAKCTPQTLRDCDFAVVLGGDGTIISAAKALSEAKVPVVGVNLGKLGFLAEFSVSEFKQMYADIVSGKASVERRMMLGCRVSDGSPADREKFCAKAVNDVFVAAGPPFRVIELKIAVDGQQVASCVTDGLIVSTPTGSTAYNLSAGGPILDGSMEAMVITPICPHSLSFRPIVIDAASVVEISFLRINEGTTVSIDGQASSGLAIHDVVRIAREQSSFLVVNNPVRTRWDTLATKLGWANRPKYAGEAG